MPTLPPGAVVSLRRALIAAAGAFLLTAAAPAAAKPAPESFAELSEKVVPAVVNISTTQTLRREDRPSGPSPSPAPGSPEELFKDFFDRQPRPDRAPRRAMSLGSGFIVGADGYIVTN